MFAKNNSNLYLVFVPKYRFYICDNCGKTNDNCFGSYCAYDSLGSESGLGKYKA